jgi:putative tricarboxylic transport membrane protein
MGANMIPMLTLGIPGSVSAALIVSAFMIHGVQPGPFLFEQQGRLIYGLFGAMILANLMNLLVGQVGMQFWVRVITAPESFVLTSALLLCFVGVSLAAGGLFGIGVMLAFAILGFVMTAFGFSVVVFIIAFFLGPRFEISLSQTLALLNGDPLRLLDYPFGFVMIVAAPGLAVWLARRRA